MKNYIIINKKIYEKYKDEVLSFNARLFCDPYYYQLESYQDPIDLLGLEKYLNYTQEIEILSTSTFLDFINILLILSFLKKSSFKGKVTIKYYILKKEKLNDALFSQVSLSINEFNEVDELLNAIKDKKPIKPTNIFLPGMLNYINFYNMMNDSEKFLMSLQDVIEEYEEDNEQIALYLQDKYSNMGLNQDFYLNYLKKICGE